MYKYGQRVRVRFPKSTKRDDAITEGMRAYEGIEATVERVYYFSTRHAYELLGIVSKKWKAYTFLDEWLEPIGKEQNDETDGSHTEILG